MGDINTIPKFFLLLALVYTNVGYLVGLRSWNYLQPMGWNYDQHGDDWKGTCATGKLQSPIALNKSEVHVIALPPLNFSKYEMVLGKWMAFANNAHYANIMLDHISQSSISGGGLQDNYEVESVAFHWGSPNTHGSEHVINGERYDLEMHIVHVNKRYDSIYTAQHMADGIAVLAVMFKITDTPYRIYPVFNKLFKNVHKIQGQRTGTHLTELALGELIADLNTQEFYKYNGSLTDPGCYEAVTWFVFPNALPIPRLQISKLWDLRDERDKRMVNNYRNLQPVNNRLVYYNSA